MRYTFSLLLLVFPLWSAPIEVKGREEKPLYLIENREDWNLIQTPSDKISDTREPLISFEKGVLKARLHSFPFYKEKGSIPPEAQISRWKKRLAPHALFEVIPFSFGGFTGLILVAKSGNEGFFGAAFSLGERGKRALRNHQELSSDWTFVVSGPAKELFEEKLALFEWVESLHLILEIPHVD